MHISSLDGSNILIGSCSSKKFSIAEAEGGEHTSQKHASVLRDREQHTFSNLLTSALLQVILWSNSDKIRLIFWELSLAFVML